MYISFTYIDTGAEEDLVSGNEEEEQIVYSFSSPDLERFIL